MDIYLVGGAVRDKLLGYPFQEKDWVVVGATAQELIDRGYKPVGKDFPVFLHPSTSEEYALARTERKTGHGYAGFDFYSNPNVTLEQDLARRDLTINAIAERDGKLVDPFNGQTDLEKHILRHVSPAFSEDPVRVLRIARFKARYHHLGFEIAEETQALMEQMVTTGEVDHLVPERVWKELTGALTERNPEEFLLTLYTCGALQQVMPELVRQATKKDFCEAIAAFKQCCDLTSSPPTRFAGMTYLLVATDNHLSAITTLCERLGAPKEYRELALLVAEHRHSFNNAAHCTAKSLVQLFKQLDAYRKTERFTLWLGTCAALAGQKHSKASQQTTLLLEKAFKVCQQVSAKELLNQGIQGKQLGAAIEVAREDQLNQLLLRDQREC